MQIICKTQALPRMLMCMYTNCYFNTAAATQVFHRKQNSPVCKDRSTSWKKPPAESKECLFANINNPKMQFCKDARTKSRTVIGVLRNSHRLREQALICGRRACVESQCGPRRGEKAAETAAHPARHSTSGGRRGGDGARWISHLQSGWWRRARACTNTVKKNPSVAASDWCTETPCPLRLGR